MNGLRRGPNPLDSTTSSPRTGERTGTVAGRRGSASSWAEIAATVASISSSRRRSRASIALPCSMRRAKIVGRPIEGPSETGRATSAGLGASA
ncbi:MAG: hypothetical protein R2862_05750 [Thermoanaerobaculia bacterium]